MLLLQQLTTFATVLVKESALGLRTGSGCWSWTQQVKISRWLEVRFSLSMLFFFSVAFVTFVKLRQRSELTGPMMTKTLSDSLLL